MILNNLMNQNFMCDHHNNNNDLNDDDNRINEKKSLANVLESFVQDEITNNDDINPFKSGIKRDPSSNYFSLFSYNLERYNMLYRMVAINIELNDCRKYDNENKYHNFYFSPLPWRYTNPDYYKEQTPYAAYNNKNMPDWIKNIDDKIFKNFEFKVLSYSPFVFHHLRILDKLSIDDVLKSLDPSKTLQMINESKEILKRGDSSMLLSWDKKLIIKTITKNEKNTFINTMLEEYHSRMRDTKSILSHVYGVFKIQIGHRENYVMLQRNMNDLFLKSNVLTFELNGSKVDRQNIKTEDINLKKPVLFHKYKNIILKDVDLDITGIKFELNPYDGKNILLSICNDSIFLQKYNVIDYSLLIFVNKYSKKHFESYFGNYSVMHDVDKKYIFNFTIVDFLDTFNFEKKSEKFVNDFVGVFKVSIDKNFNLLDPQSYGVDFRKFAKKIIIYDDNEINGEKFEDVLEDYINSEKVEIVNIRGFESAQFPTYMDCYKKYGYKFHFLLFLDFDDFVTIENNIDINSYLYNKKFKKCETILLNWKMYGDNNLVKYDNRTMIDRFTRPSSNWNKGKSIVRTNIYKLIITSSHIIGINTKYFCDSNGKRLFPKSFHQFEVPEKPEAYIKHFYTKTAEEFCNKINKGDVHFNKNNPNYLNILKSKIITFFNFNSITDEKIKIISIFQLLNQFMKRKIIFSTN